MRHPRRERSQRINRRRLRLSGPHLLAQQRFERQRAKSRTKLAQKMPS